MPPTYAHSGRNKDYSDWQLLRDHLLGVATLARRFGDEARPGDAALVAAAYAAGLLHDLGKYRPEFQQMIRGLHPRNETTHHKQAGAAKAADAGNLPVAFAVAGHHGGLPDHDAFADLLRGPSGRAVAAGVWPTATSDCPELVSLALAPPHLPDRLAADLLTRLIFSCLVDADWYDTGEHQRRIDGHPAEPPAPTLEPATRLASVLNHIRERAMRCKEPTIASARDDILRACLTAAEWPPGLFALTVPTGGGKTLSGLAFALRHAAAHGLRRVIYIAPYLTILDQNVRVIREAIGVGHYDPTVFEHHSLAEPPGDEAENETRREAAARRAENWDAPVVLTTNVQFLESLFSNRPGRCRKLHNVARSVILLDECQTLPPDLVAPTCAMLGQLASPQLGCTVVLCTATQPAFDHPDMKERLEDVRDVIPKELDLFKRLRRVRVSWPGRGDEPLGWPEVAERMRGSKAALCVVNTRRAARELFAELRRWGGDTFHLSTGMCPAHRLEVLDEVRRRLDAGEPCFLVSTQLIEAGVDVDFPFVLRELAPLEAVIQAAGRCNREGRLNSPDGSPGGRVEVFRSLEGTLPADRWYRAGRSVVETSFLSAGRVPQVDAPADIAEYFERLYRTGNLDGQRIQDARRRYAFKEVAEKYRLIDNEGEPVVAATWDQKRTEVEALLDAARRRPTRANFRRLVPFQINLRRHERDKLDRAVAEEAPGLLVWRGGYDADIGLTADNADALLLV
jgi:CRISPR-associated endonuclease/helicase Cas3